MNQVLIIAGLGDGTEAIEKLTKSWPEKYDVQPTVYAYGWGDPVDTYEEKQTKILNTAEHLAGLGALYAIGISAGGHKAVELYDERPDLFKGAINICGPMRIKNYTRRLKENPLFQHSLELFMKRNLSSKNIMTMRPLYDSVVSVSTVPVEGAHNIRMNTIGHVPSIFWALKCRGQTIESFIHGEVARAVQ